MTEAELRDLIAENISVLEDGLVLLTKEQFIPSSLGTRSFIDLYAKDRYGHHVLIELKRADSAARDALHEVHKYVEGVKEHFSTRDDEIRVIVASTEWKELLVPFSRFSADTKMTVVGLQLHVDASNVITASPIALVPISRGRFIAPWHEVNWYLDEQSLEKGIKSIEVRCEKLGIKDFIITRLRPPKPSASEHQAAMWATLREIAGMRGVEAKELALPVYKYIAYFAMQMLTREQCVQLLSQNGEELEEVRQTTEGMAEEEELQYLHEVISAIEPRPGQDHFEIGYAAKLRKFVETCEYQIEQVLRYGRLARNPLLNDEAILSELKAEDGATGQNVKRTVSIENRAHITSARAAIAECLEQNAAWKGNILSALDEIECEFPRAEVDIHIFNPATGLMTPYLITKRDDGLLFLPSYELTVRNPDAVRMYYGALKSEGTALTFRQLLNKYYEGDLAGLLFTMSWGGRESRDADIAEDMGVAYKSFRCDAEGARRTCFEFKDGRWKPCDPVHNIGLYNEYLEKNEQLLHEIVAKIAACDKGGYWDSVNIGKILDENHADVERGKKKRLRFAGAPDTCNLCGCAFADEKYMIDGKILNARGMWACMCADCFTSNGEGLGIGLGQLYLNHDKGWLQVGGFDEPEDASIQKREGLPKRSKKKVEKKKRKPAT